MVLSVCYFKDSYMILCVITDISIAAVDLLQEMTDVETDDENEDAINAFFDALVGITFL